MSKPKEASDVVATYGWPEPSVGSSTSGTLYNVVSREIGGEITYFRVGDVALFEAEGSAPPYVGVIEKLWESPDSEMLLTARWFFRPSDCPSGLLLSSEVRSNELFYSSQRDVNSVTSLIDKVRVNFEREGFTIGPLELPDEIRGSITNFVCNSEFIGDKKRIRYLKPKVLAFLKSRARTGLLSDEDSDPEGRFSSADAALPSSNGVGAAQATPGYGSASPDRPHVILSDAAPWPEGGLVCGSPRLLTSPGALAKPHAEAPRRYTRVGKEYQAAVPTSIRENLRRIHNPLKGVDVPIVEIDATLRSHTWASEEVLRFCVAFNKHGKNFRLIAADVKTKTVKACVEYYYNNKYKSNRQYLRDRLYNQETAAISERFAGQSVAVAPSERVGTDVVSDGESGSECGSATPGVVPVGTVASKSTPSSTSTGCGKTLPKRMRKPETSSWCTTCVVTRPSVLPCAWSLCGNTCTDGVPVPETGQQHASRPKIVLPSASTAVAEKLNASPPSATPQSVPSAPKPPTKPDSKKRKRPTPTHPSGGSAGKAVTSQGGAVEPSLLSMDMPYVRDAQVFLDSVNVTYMGQPHVYRSIVRLLQLFQDGFIPEQDLARQCVALLRPTPELVKHFTLFLSTDVQLSILDVL